MNRGPLLERRSPFRVTYALLILIAFFFVLPSGFRAARLSLNKRENDVKDWLPSDFPETAELEWFADHFVDAKFVLATWPGCTEGDQRLTLLERKLKHESDAYDPSADFPPALAASYRRAKEVGNELQLLQGGSDFYDWGGQKEKWLRTPTGQWYYITPKGHLFRWEESSNAPAAALRATRKKLGLYQLRGQFVTAFGEEPGERIANPFHNDPSLLCASLFHSVRTGESVVDELAREGGSLWPIDLTDEDRREVVARRRAMERLTGSLFAPAVPNDFRWTTEAFRLALPQEKRGDLSPEFDALVSQTLDRIVEEKFEGSLSRLKSATLEAQTEAWYTVFDAAEVEPPPRPTCVFVTLTALAEDNLSYALGRGVLGEPRGRLLQLAEESGISAPPPPSMAPPPFDRPEPEAIAGMPPLRMGGPPVDNMAIDEEGSVTLVRLVGYSVLLGIVLSYLCFGSIKITIMVFVVGGSAAMLSMAMVWWTAGRVDAILMSMPSLVYVLGLSGAIHVINYYRDEVRARGQSGAAGRALRHALLPCTLASVTTAIGLISLVTSNLAPISNFGLYSAVGVIATLAILFSYLPAALETFAPPVDGNDQREPLKHEPRREGRLSEWWAGIGRWITRHHAVVSVACLAALIIGGMGLTKIKTSVQLLKLFDPNSRIIHDYAWLETNFGKLVPMELIVRVPPSMQAESGAALAGDGESSSPSVESLNVLERVEAISRVRTVIHRTLGEPGRDIVGQAMSADTFLPPLPAPTNNYDIGRAKFNRDLLESSEELRHNDYLRIEKSGAYVGSELWRISLRVAALSDVDYGHFISTLRTAVEPVLRAYDARDELLSQLVTDSGGKLKGKPKVLVLGSQRPATLAETKLISDDREEILAHSTFVATLGELLSGERIEKPIWRAPTPDLAAKMVANEKWEKYLQTFDAVIWLGGEEFAEEDFAAAKGFVNASVIEHKTVHPRLLPGRIPDVEGSGPLQVVYTGVVPVVYKAQRTLLTSLANSIGLAFVLIACVMILLLNPGRPPLGWLAPSKFGNGLMAGMVAMIPNVFPVVMIFGVMCHMDIDIDIGTMMTASVAMGVAVDDTIHFLSWFRAHLDRGMNRVEAVIETYRRVGPAMTQTTIVGGLGLFVFALSTFTPTQRFGTLMLVMLAAALIGDLILLPALLAGPAGRWFKPRTDRNGRPVNSDGARLESGTEATDPGNDHSQESPQGDVAANLDDAIESLTHLKVHFPNERKDPSHRVKGK